MLDDMQIGDLFLKCVCAAYGVVHATSMLLSLPIGTGASVSELRGHHAISIVRVTRGDDAFSPGIIEFRSLDAKENCLQTKLHSAVV